MVANQAISTVGLAVFGWLAAYTALDCGTGSEPAGSCYDCGPALQAPGFAMLRARLTLLLCLLTSAALAQDARWLSLAERFSMQPLRWGGDAEGGAPFQLRDPQDPEHVIGFEVELADALARELSQVVGKPIIAEFVQYEWVSLPLGLEKEDFDFILSGFEITAENEQAVLFSRPYYIYTQQLVARRDDDSIHTIADLLPKRVGTLSGSAAEKILSRAGVTEVVAFDGQVEPYKDLELGRLDAVLLDLPIATFYGRANANLKFVGQPLGRGEYGIAVRRDDRLLKEAVDLALGRLMVGGQMRDIYRRWHLWNGEQAALARNAEELTGLGFDASGEPKPEYLVPPEDAVELNILAASAQQWTFAQYAPLLLRSAGMTIFLTVTSMAVAMTIGLVVCLLRLYGPGPMKLVALAYVEFFRGIPLLLLLFFLYFGLSSFGIELPAIATAILGFGLNYAAYESEIYRSAIQAVPIGQWEAGRALGMSEGLAFRRVIFPQSFRIALGPITNDIVALFKDTSLVSVIAVRELTKEYLILSRSSMKFVELGLLTAALYLLMSVPLGYLSRYLERRWGGKIH
jgi:polar amino acid transport system substrate-binding protein